MNEDTRWALALERAKSALDPALTKAENRTRALAAARAVLHPVR